MNAIEFETQYAEALAHYSRRPSADVLGQGFRPLGGACAHLTSVRLDGEYHFVYSELRLAGASALLPGNALHLGRASTHDFLSWQVHEPTLVIQPGTWESTHVLTPALVEYKDRYLLAYAATNDVMAQDIGLAFSDDLRSWNRLPTNPVSPARGRDWAFWRNTGASTCRAPYLFRHRGRLYMSYTAVTRGGASCIALASTTDLVGWEDHGPILVGPSEGFVQVDPGDPAPQEPLDAACLLFAEGRWRLIAHLRLPGVNPTCWVFESDDLFSFDYGARREFWKDAYTAHPIKHAGARSLFVCPGLVRFGEVDWSAPEPRVEYVMSAEALQAWKD
jgi:hypothetical protein